MKDSNYFAVEAKAEKDSSLGDVLSHKWNAKMKASFSKKFF